eukprot:TRINITY_DN55338_c0_g2_i1.p1 TRINITY_DN55338_c0_g2~~TRINITY_DN55338_c0_g2_i1.p1  ORF type:complete len:698 (+),score=63.03 TRINITY_DN55338_c0_g2_i1:57-2150(+)
MDPPSSATEVLALWFDGDAKEKFQTHWFPAEGSQKQAEIDKLVRDKYASLLQDAEEGKLDEEWKKTSQGHLALILVLDQFSRHVHRQDRAKIDRNDIKALALAQEFVDQNRGNTLTPPELIFSLFPFRHSPTVARLQFVLDQVEARTPTVATWTEMLTRFKRATLTRLQHLQGVQWTDGDEILEHHPFEGDFSDVEKSPVWCSMKAFLTKYNAEQHKTLVVSLSGGVDSMVIAQLLVLLSPQFGGFNVVAVHIDYGNRPESGAEAAYVEEWCNKHKIIFRKRTITEAKRATANRDYYEKLSRTIRYTAYADALEEFNAPGVMFGHHQGDIQENVISNMMKRVQLLDISGMGETGIVNDVVIWRPLLSHVKDDIISFAHKYGVPYFLDTTPKWSTRGTMRNQLLPLLTDMYGHGYKNNLTTLAEHSNQLADLVNSRILQPFWDACVQTNLAVYVDCGPFLDMPLFFWREALRHVCHSMLGQGMISDKPIQMQLMERLLAAKNAQHNGQTNTETEQPEESAPKQDKQKVVLDGFVELRKDARFYLAGTTFIMFRPGYFPNKGKAKTKKGENVDATAEQPKDITIGGGPVKFGNWTVLVEEDKADNVDEAVLDLFDMLQGTFSYWLQVPENAPNALVVDNCNRPARLRQLPKPITDPIPVVMFANEMNAISRKQLKKMQYQTKVKYTDRWLKVTLAGSLR